MHTAQITLRASVSKMAKFATFVASNIRDVLLGSIIVSPWIVPFGLVELSEKVSTWINLPITLGHPRVSALVHVYRLGSSAIHLQSSYHRHARLRILGAVVRLVAWLTTCMAHYILSLHLLNWVDCREVKRRMSKLASGAFRAKSYEVVYTKDPPCMPVSASGTMPTEPTIIPWAVFDLGRGVYVLKGAFFI